LALRRVFLGARPPLRGARTTALAVGRGGGVSCVPCSTAELGVRVYDVPIRHVLYRAIAGRGVEESVEGQTRASASASWSRCDSMLPGNNLARWRPPRSPRCEAPPGRRRRRQSPCRRTAWSQEVLPHGARIGRVPQWSEGSTAVTPNRALGLLDEVSEPSEHHVPAGRGTLEGQFTPAGVEVEAVCSNRTSSPGQRRRRRRARACCWPT
jgi:hypothetical protein